MITFMDICQNWRERRKWATVNSLNDLFEKQWQSLCKSHMGWSTIMDWHSRESFHLSMPVRRVAKYCLYDCSMNLVNKNDGEKKGGRKRCLKCSSSYYTAPFLGLTFMQLLGTRRSNSEQRYWGTLRAFFLFRKRGDSIQNMGKQYWQQHRRTFCRAFLFETCFGGHLIIDLRRATKGDASKNKYENEM